MSLEWSVVSRMVTFLKRWSVIPRMVSLKMVSCVEMVSCLESCIEEFYWSVLLRIVSLEMVFLNCLEAGQSRDGQLSGGWSVSVEQHHTDF